MAEKASCDCSGDSGTFTAVNSFPGYDGDNVVSFAGATVYSNGDCGISVTPQICW